jgi:fatty acid desaturase
MNKKISKIIPVVVVSLTLAFFLTFILLYFDFFVHELGHANIALLSGQAKQIPSITINFTYQPLMLLGYNIGLKYPQQTEAIILNSFNPLFKVSGVLFSLFFWSIIFLFLYRIKLLRENKYLSFSLAITFLALVINDIISNMFCGTDGFNFVCGKVIFEVLFYSFWFAILLSLGFFFSLLFFIFLEKIKHEGENDN